MKIQIATVLTEAGLPTLSDQQLNRALDTGRTWIGTNGGGNKLFSVPLRVANGGTLVAAQNVINFVGFTVANNTTTGATDVTASAPGTGTVTSVGLSAGTTGFAFSGSPITTSGTFTMSGTLNLLNGGTGATTATAARANLGAAASALILTAGTGLSGTGNLTANRTFAINDTGVTAGVYSYPRFATVNAQGQLTSLSQGTGLEPGANNIAVGRGVSYTYSGTSTGFSQLPVAILARNGSTVTLPRVNPGLALFSKVYIRNTDAAVNPSVVTVVVGTVYMGVDDFTSLNTGPNLYETTFPNTTTINLSYGDGLHLIYMSDGWVVAGHFQRKNASGASDTSLGIRAVASTDSTATRTVVPTDGFIYVGGGGNAQILLDAASYGVRNNLLYVQFRNNTGGSIGLTTGASTGGTGGTVLYPLYKFGTDVGINAVPATPGDTFVIVPGMARWDIIAIIPSPTRFRNAGRSVQNTDSSAVRTLTVSDSYLSLEGAGGVLKLHTATDAGTGIGRGNKAWIRNNSSGNWDIIVDNVGTEAIYQAATGVTTLTLTPGQAVSLFNRTNTRWEVVGNN